jgi:hypothetical protein
MIMAHQTHTFWCWAAVAVSVDRLFAPTSTGLAQCELVARVLPGAAACCSTPNLFNQPASLQTALTAVDNLKEMKVGPLSFAQIKEQLSAQRPVCCRIQWFGQGGHAVAVDGCLEYASGEQIVHVVDPFYSWGPGGGDYIPYDEFVSSYRSSGEWTHTYLVKP